MSLVGILIAPVLVSPLHSFPGMAHTAKNYGHLIGQIEGLSEKQLRAHFSLYEGYVKKTNEIEDKIKKVDLDAVSYSFGEFSELLRRQSVPFNGAYLHELY